MMQQRDPSPFFHERTGDRVVLNRRGLLTGIAAAAALMPLAGCGLFDDDEKPILAGRREDVLSTGAGLIVDESDTTPITLPAPVLTPDWQQPGRIPSHEAVNEATTGGQAALKRRWTTSLGTGEGGRLVLAAEPVVAGGRIYAMDARGVVNAFDAGDGHRIWRTDTKPKKSRSSNVGGGLTFADNIIYVVDGVAESLALDAATGKILWRVNVGTPGRSAPTVIDGRMFFGTIDERLFALDVANGNQLWVYQATASDTIVFGQPAPAVVGGTVLAGFGSGDIAAIRAETGELLWSDTLGSTGGRNSILDFSSVHGLPVISDGTAYVISVGRVFTAIDIRSGRRLWERSVGGKDDLVVVGDWIFMLSQDQQLACLDKANGHVRWVTTLPRFRKPKPGKGPIGWAGPLLVDGQLVCVSDFPKQGMILVDALTGKVTRTEKLAHLAAMPPIAAGGQMLLITDDGMLSSYG
ncbi:PQQ-like beta-propeller repeat protein [Acetobacteraceae bacterium KSS8]|uniref:PQQ-like beta-propeller repeat protein n=2 Tax=Endosaccharibacter trunci TaxID=2812733 RepID=A0ABT1WBB9_9PROT|nr:PQQ-like beta-propeller repeat protein [Acetobacteraceae bacterium KSS8]